jgi:hypothetical protein
MAGHVAVVDAQRPRRWPLADGAGAVLPLAHALVTLAIQPVLALALLPAPLLAERGIAVVARAPPAAEVFGMRDPPGAVVGELAGAVAGVLRIAPAMLLVAEGQCAPRMGGPDARNTARGARRSAGGIKDTGAVAQRGKRAHSPRPPLAGCSGRTIQAQFCRMDRGYLTRVTTVKKNFRLAI